MNAKYAREMPMLQRVRPWVPAVAFLGGFIWDAVTPGRTIKTVDLFILLGYLAGAAALLVALGRGVTFRGSHFTIVDGEPGKMRRLKL